MKSKQYATNVWESLLDDERAMRTNDDEDEIEISITHFLDGQVV